MTDSVAVFPPGFRVTDADTGAPVSGAVIRFYDAGTTNPKTVYSDYDLETEIGTSVTTNSLGYPTTDGTTRTLIYVGTAAYKITIEDADAVVLATHDNVKGAVAVFEPTDTSVIATTPVVTKSLDYTIVTADQSKVFVGNCSSADVTFTLPSAVTVGDGWSINIEHAGAAHQVLIETVSSQTIASGYANYNTVMVLTRSGEAVRLVSDGGNWRIVSHTAPHIKGNAQGMITVADRLTAPPGSEVNGDIYLISGTPSGAWSSFAAGDLAQYTSSAWVNFTPPSDCGWHVYVQDEDKVYRYIGTSWVAEDATSSRAGTVQLADAAAAQAMTANRVADASIMHNHPGVAKFWVYVTVSAGVPTIAASYNVTSIIDNGTGDLIVTIATDFADVNWVVFALARTDSINSARFCYEQGSSHAAGSTNIICENSGGTKVDPVAWHIIGFGDQV